jgi:hypothetical protein
LLDLGPIMLVEGQLPTSRQSTGFKPICLEQANYFTAMPVESKLPVGFQFCERIEEAFLLTQIWEMNVVLYLC